MKKEEAIEACDELNELMNLYDFDYAYLMGNPKCTLSDINEIIEACNVIKKLIEVAHKWTRIKW